MSSEELVRIAIAIILISTIILSGVLERFIAKSFRNWQRRQATKIHKRRKK